MNLKQIRWLLMGRKTYIASVLLGTYAVLKAFNVINVTPEQNQAIIVLLGAVLGVTISAKINRKV